MAKLVLTNPAITIGGVDLADHVASVSLNQSFADVATTAFGSTAVTRVAGLGDHSVSLDFHEDFATGEVHATIASAVGTSVAVTIKAVDAATAADNPEYSFNVLVTEWPLLNGAVGDLATASVTWPVTGDITTATS
jgi:hypothetical protein